MLRGILTVQQILLDDKLFSIFNDFWWFTRQLVKNVYIAT